MVDVSRYSSLKQKPNRVRSLPQNPDVVNRSVVHNSSEYSTVFDIEQGLVRHECTIRTQEFIIDLSHYCKNPYRTVDVSASDVRTSRI